MAEGSGPAMGRETLGELEGILPQATLTLKQMTTECPRQGQKG